MAEVIFYEKPGCINNTKQKKLLAEAGHEVDARNLLQTAWSARTLRSYFGDLPVAQWFNRSHPRVKSGEVDIDHLDEESALSLMIDEPLFIRRPLMLIDGQHLVGFDAEQVDALIGLEPIEGNPDLESCPRSHSETSCSDTAAKVKAKG